MKNGRIMVAKCWRWLNMLEEKVEAPPQWAYIDSLSVLWLSHVDEPHSGCVMLKSHPYPDGYGGQQAVVYEVMVRLEAPWSHTVGYSNDCGALLLPFFWLARTQNNVAPSSLRPTAVRTVAPTATAALQNRVGHIGVNAISVDEAVKRRLVFVTTISQPHLNMVFHRPKDPWYADTNAGYYTTEAEARAEGCTEIDRRSYFKKPN